ASRRVRAGRAALAATLTAVLVVEAALAYQRNAVWSGEIPLWEDAVKKSPRKARVHLQLAMAYYNVNRCHEAEEHFQTVAKMEEPDYRLLLDWALADNCLNRPDEAMRKLQ